MGKTMLEKHNCSYRHKQSQEAHDRPLFVDPCALPVSESAVTPTAYTNVMGFLEAGILEFYVISNDIVLGHPIG